MTQPIQAPSNQQNTTQLASSIVYATWNTCRAYAGTNAEIEVRTGFVGEGAKIQIRLEGEQSGALGGVDDTIFGNRYIADIPIPDSVQVDEKIWFTATLPQLGLNAQSEKIPVFPPIKLVKIEWGQQEARRGDIIDIRAEFLGLRDIVPCEVHILEYDRDGNHDPINRIPSEIRNGRLNLRWEYEYHEDTDEIPTEDELQQYGNHYNPPEYFFVVEVGGQRFGEAQESGLLKFKDFIDIQIKTASGDPVKSANLSIELADGSQQTISTGEDGSAFIASAPPGRYVINVASSVTEQTEEQIAETELYAESPKKIRFILYTSALKQSDINTFRDAASTIASDYKANFKDQECIVKKVNTGKEIVDLINGLDDKCIVSLDIVSHSNLGGIHIASNLTAPIKTSRIDPDQSNLHVLIRNFSDRPQTEKDAEFIEESMHGLYSDSGSRLFVSYYYNQTFKKEVNETFVDNTDTAFISEINFNKFCDDAFVEFHGCKTAEFLNLSDITIGLLKISYPQVSLGSLKSNFARDFSIRLPSTAYTLGHITYSSPDKHPNKNRSDYRYGKVRIFRNGKLESDSVERWGLKLPNSSTPPPYT